MRYDVLFEQTKDMPIMLTGLRAKERWSAFGLDDETLMKIWALADLTQVSRADLCTATLKRSYADHRSHNCQDGRLDVQEHRIAMHLITLVRAGIDVPSELPAGLAAAAARPPEASVNPRAFASVIEGAPTPKVAAPIPTMPPMEVSPWAIRDEDARLYRQFFESADLARRGRVTPVESQLSRSGLPHEVLMKV